MAKRILETEHVAGLSVIEGGLGAYESAGGVTVKGRTILSFERQVRIAAEGSGSGCAARPPDAR